MRQNLHRVGHLGHLDGVNERCGLNPPQARGHQLPKNLQLEWSRDGNPFKLEPVPGTDLTKLYSAPFNHRRWLRFFVHFLRIERINKCSIAS